MKKLWQRSKSKARGVHRERGDSTNAVSTTPKTNPVSRHDPTIPPLPERSGNRKTGDTAPRSVSGKIQPMLIGISRPSGTLSRPGTSGSLQDAIDRAADKVAGLPSSEGHKGHARTQSPRYVDIFAIHNSHPSISSYNEDIAERNIDVKKVAQDAVHYRYVPSSKYQEEVSSRNTHSHTKSADGLGHEDLPPRQEPPRSQSAMNSAYIPPPAKAAEVDNVWTSQQARSDASRTSDLRDSSSNASRFTGDGSPKAGAHQSAGAQALARNYLPTAPIPYEPAKSAHVNSLSGEGFQLQRQEGQYKHQPSGNTAPLQPLTKSNLSMIAEASPLPDYRLSQTEKKQHETALRSTSRPLERKGVSSKYSNQPERSVSTGADASSVRRALNIQNRTIMDLTGDDEEVFSNPYSASDLSKSPVLEQAKTDAFRRVQPALVSSGGREHGNVNGTVSQNKAVREEPKSTNARTASTQANAEDDPPASTFSSISTILSVPPSTRLNSEPAAQQEEKVLWSNKSKPRSKSSKLHTVTENELDADETPTAAKKPEPLPVYELPATSRDRVVQSDPESATQTTPVDHGASFPPPTSLPPPTALEQTNAAESNPNRIQMSPEILQSRDFIDPSRPFGVTAWDFAVDPSRPVPASRSDREPNTSAKVTQPRNVVGIGDAVRPIESFVPNDPEDRLATGFDEEKFRLKKEQARAALIKLQQSLNAEFVAPPRIVRQSRKTNTTARTQANPSNASNDSRPVNSGSIFSQVRDYHSTRPLANGEVQPRGSSARHKFSTQEASSSNRPESSASNKTVKPLERPKSRSGQSKEKDRELGSALSEMQRLADEMRNPRLVALAQSHPVVQNKDTKANNRYSASTNSTSGSEVLPSPGEISLSAFPPPATVQHSRENSLNLPIQNPADATPPNTTRNSVQSQLRSDDQLDAAAPAPTIPISTPPRTNVSSQYQQRKPPPPPQQQQKTNPLAQASNSTSPPPPSIPHSPGERKVMSRRNSAQSQASAMTSSSQFSIPFHLIPERGSSMRDSMVREVDDEA